jgi:hypothetical protein
MGNVNRSASVSVKCRKRKPRGESGRFSEHMIAANGPMIEALPLPIFSRRGLVGSNERDLDQRGICSVGACFSYLDAFDVCSRDSGHGA